MHLEIINYRPLWIHYIYIIQFIEPLVEAGSEVDGSVQLKRELRLTVPKFQ
jgi:hypothetical protein